MQTRLFKITKQIIFNTKRQFKGFRGELTNTILYLFIGFITGNTFGAFFLSYIRVLGLWDGAIISIFLIWFEQIGQRIYKPTYNKKKSNYMKLINCWKTGIILGFFIDAFKVGS